MYNDRRAFHPGINSYVPAMQFASVLTYDRSAGISLGKPVANAANGIAAALAGNAANGTKYAVNWTSDVPYGRNVTMTPSADPTTAAAVYEIRGFDYLRQPMLERISLPSGATALVAGKKAFFRVVEVRVITAAVAAITVNVGFAKELGLPYKGYLDWAKEAGAYIAAPNSTLTVGVVTDPATATTGDPRGTYAPAMTPDGVKEVIIGLIGDNTVNAAGNGGLHGIAHYYA